MSLGSSDERDLILPLFAGVDEHPLWDTFLHRLLARTRASKICMLLRPAGEIGPPRFQRVIVPRGEKALPLDIEAFSDAGLLPYASLRPNRVYSLDETIMMNSADSARRQREMLVQADITHARFMRIPARTEDDIWLILLRDLHDFGASVGALLSALAPHIALALSQLFESAKLRLRTAMAEEALAMLGVGQAAFDAEGRVIAADDLATAELDIPPNGRMQLRGSTAQALGDACASMAQALRPARQVLRMDERSAKDMLLRPAPPIPGALPSGAHAVGLIRRDVRENAASAARVTMQTLGLSAREAALAEAISQGRSIIEAGAELQLTQETARNYSKRIYAKTGASGQADLVRMMLSGLSPFA